MKLAVLPGDDRPDERLAAFSTVPPALVEELDTYFRAGGVDNMRALLRRIAREIGEPVEAAAASSLAARFRVVAA